MAKQDLVTFTVEGSLEFPWDMLRYDSCWPYEGDDAALINRRTDRNINIQIRRIVLQGLHRPTIQRWESFNWRVVCIGIERTPHGPIKAFAPPTPA